MRAITIVAASALLAACGGGGGGGGGTDLSQSPNLKTLFDTITADNQQTQFETNAQYTARLATFATGLTGYHATEGLNADYDVNAGELRIHDLPISISEGQPDDNTTTFYRGFTKMAIQNPDTLYTPTQRTTNGVTLDYYKVFQISPTDAQKIIDGFKADMTYVFSGDQVKGATFSCIGPPNPISVTECSNNLFGNVAAIRVHNVVDGKDY